MFFARRYLTTYDVAVEAYTKLEDIEIHALWRAHRFIYIRLPSNPHLHESNCTKILVFNIDKINVFIVFTYSHDLVTARFTLHVH